MDISRARAAATPFLERADLVDKKSTGVPEAHYGGAKEDGEGPEDVHQRRG